MSKTKKFKNYNKHLRNYILLSLLVSLGMLVVTGLTVISLAKPDSFVFEIPFAVHVLALFISSMMAIMGLYYFKTAKK